MIDDADIASASRMRAHARKLGQNIVDDIRRFGPGQKATPTYTQASVLTPPQPERRKTTKPKKTTCKVCGPADDKYPEWGPCPHQGDAK